MRSDLLDMLAGGLPQDAISLGTEVRTLGIHDDRTELGLTGGAVLDARLVVGADGVHSRIRDQAFARTGARSALLAQSSWRFMAPNPGVDFWTLWTSAECMVLLAPVGDHSVYGWAALTRSRSDDRSAWQLDRATRHFPERVRQAIRHASSHRDGLHHSPLEEVRLDRWHEGRTVLIGDAAHATAPVWAQGAALALEDAIVLARCLSAHPDVPTALIDFQDQRMARVSHVQALTDAMSRAAKLPPLIRNALLPFIRPKRDSQTYEPLKKQV